MHFSEVEFARFMLLFLFRARIWCCTCKLPESDSHLITSGELVRSNSSFNDSGIATWRERHSLAHGSHSGDLLANEVSKLSVHPLCE